MAGKIATAQQQRAAAPEKKQEAAKNSLAAMVNAALDQDGMRKRFEELLGKRTPQFVSALVSLLNGTPQLMEAFKNAPITVIQSALKAASYDLPIDPALGYAYIVPFKNKQPSGDFRMEAQFIMGYKGMLQLAMRTGAYSKINVTDVRAGEVKSYDRLKEDIVIEWIEDESERERAEIAGYVGYFRLVNGMEKTLYMTIAQIEAHERKHRKGQNRGMGWTKFFDAMCRKTVLRKLIGSWGLMSIDYQTANAQTVQAATAIAQGKYDDEDTIPEVTDNGEPVVDTSTGEVIDYSGTPFANEEGDNNA